MWLGLGHTDRVEVSWAISYLWSWLEELGTAWPIRSPVHYFQFSDFCGMKGSASSPLKRQFFYLIFLVSLEICGQGPCAPNICTHIYIFAVLEMEPGALCMPIKSLTAEPHPRLPLQLFFYAHVVV